MNFTEKLKIAAEGKNKAERARSVGLPDTAISNYIASGSIPRADIALKLARALDVPVDWLIDDEQGPPIPPTTKTASLSSEQLVQELGRRLAAIGTLLLSKIVRAEKVSWYSVATGLLEADVNAPLNEHTRQLAELPAQINVLTLELMSFNPHAAIDANAPAELISTVGAEHELSLLELWARQLNLRQEFGFSQVAQLANLWLIPEDFRPPWFSENIKHTRDTVAAELANATGKVRTIMRVPVPKALRTPPPPVIIENSHVWPHPRDLPNIPKGSLVELQAIVAASSIGKPAASNESVADLPSSKKKQHTKPEK